MSDTNDGKPVRTVANGDGKRKAKTGKPRKITSSLMRAKARRRACRSPRLASVISRSATRRSSLALGSVVAICSCLISAEARLESSAARWVAVRLSLRPWLR